MISGRYADYIDRLVQAVTFSAGKTAPGLRTAVQAKARRLAGLTEADIPPNSAVPASLSSYLDAVLGQAYRITDQDVEKLRATHSDDEIFETTVNAAVGTGLARLERALEILREGR